MEIVKDLVIPTSAARSGARGSKFFSSELAEVLNKLNLNEGVVLPFMDLGAVQKPQERQRYATDYRVKQWSKDSGRTYKVFIVPQVAAIAAQGKEGKAGYIAAVAGNAGGVGIKLVAIAERKA